MTKTYKTVPVSEATSLPLSEPQAEFMINTRKKLGEMWGLERPLTRAELARALDMSPKWGGSHISKLEAEGPRQAQLTGPLKVAMYLMLDGGRPRTMDGVIKPGYPRGAVV